MPDLTILIPAAGASSRMRGRDKLLEPVDGQPLIARQARVALTTACPVIVTLRENDPRAAALLGLDLTLLPVPDAATGLAASFRAVAARVETALMILPADMPDLTADDLAAMIKAFARDTDSIHRGATAEGRPGHPVILPARYLSDIATLSGDTGAKDLVARTGANLVTLPGDHAITDLDTPEDWSRWRQHRQEPTKGRTKRRSAVTPPAAPGPRDVSTTVAPPDS